MERRDRPIVVQADGSILADLRHPDAALTEEAVSAFATLVKSPEPVATWRVDAASLWGAAAMGHTAAGVLACLDRLSRWPVPDAVASLVRGAFSSFGAAVLQEGEGGLQLVLREDVEHLASHPLIAPLLAPGSLTVQPADRLHLAVALATLGAPLDDRTAPAPEATLGISLRERTGAGEPLALRPYQAEALAAVLERGSGIVVLPPGAGKTVIGLAAICALGLRTLVLTSSIHAARQWIREALDKTTLEPDAIGEYAGTRRQVRPVTVTTYSLLASRRSGDGTNPHAAILAAAGFELLVLDDVHRAAAPSLQASAVLAAPRRLGLTATLVREDGREDAVHAVVGPRVFERSWRSLESDAWIARAVCREVRLALPPAQRAAYEAAAPMDRHRVAASAPAKIDVCRALLDTHADSPALVLGVFRDQLDAAAAALGAPVLTGATPVERREELLAGFRAGHHRILVLGPLGSEALDLPTAAVAVQLSGSRGSRLEEAQRVGRLMRPKERPVTFYSLVARDTVEQDFALHRQAFLAAQGYRYEILDWSPGASVARSNVIQLPLGPRT